jgi:hypothetical protein
MKQIEYLTSMLYSQLGITQTILDGTADEKTMLNYYSRTIEPIVAAVVDEMKRKFLTKTARTQNQSIVFFRSPFKLVPVAELAKFADTFTRNEIMTSNEFRQIVGLKPSTDPKADQLINSNISQPNAGQEMMDYPPEMTEEPSGMEYDPALEEPGMEETVDDGGSMFDIPIGEITEEPIMEENVVDDGGSMFDIPIEELRKAVR